MMTEKNGVARLRQAIENQASVGEASFSMPFDEASALLRECEDELARLAWAKGVPVPKDADGEVVPLTTKVMYTGFGDEITLKRFMFYYSNFRKCFVWHVASQDNAIFNPRAAAREAEGRGFPPHRLHRLVRQEDRGGNR